MIGIGFTIKRAMVLLKTWERAGLQGVGYGMGVAVGDYDNDGFEDLYVTAYGGNKLYHNNGDGTFIDVTEKAGVTRRCLSL